GGRGGGAPDGPARRGAGALVRRPRGPPMRLPAAIPATPRFAPLAALGLVAGLAVPPARGAGQQPASTTPTIPAPLVRTHSTGYPAPTQAAAPLPLPHAAPDAKADEAKAQELTLGERITIALERQPTI